MNVIKRQFIDIIHGRLKQKSPLLQILLGPRQVGKTTGMKQLMSQWDGQSLYFTADLPHNLSRGWIQECWQKARAAQSNDSQILLILDEVQRFQAFPNLFYWREANAEVDFVAEYRDQVIAVEVKSGRKKSEKGLSSFKQQFPKSKTIILDLDSGTQFLSSQSPKDFILHLM